MARDDRGELKRIRIEGFRSIHKCDIQLSEVTSEVTIQRGGSNRLHTVVPTCIIIMLTVSRKGTGSRKGGKTMKHIQTIQHGCLKQSAEKGGCGACQSSCQSACKTSCTVANQACAKQDK